MATSPAFRLLLLAAVLAAAPAAVAESAVPPSSPTHRAALLSLEEAAGKILQLGEKFTPEQYAWSPMEGVVSVQGAIVHVASSYYFIAARLGTPPPAGLDRRALGRGADKVATLAIYRAALDHVTAAIRAVPPERLGEEVELFGGRVPLARLLILAGDHTHEHLGQLIAYARMNRVVPPWSR
jgi:uncharacterized damage-inducible protein DinB